MIRSIVLACAFAFFGVMLGACSQVGQVNSVAAQQAGKALVDYCALSPQQRSLLQLVIVGKAYNTGICDIVNGSVDLKAQLLVAAKEEVDVLIAAAVANAVAEGRITAEQAAALTASAAQ